MPSNLHAVLVADVVGSRAHQNLRPSLAHLLASASRKHFREKLILLPYAVTAGDEFQTVASAPAAVPRLLLDLRSMFQPLSLHIGVGIGAIADRIEPPVNRLSGEAFQFARDSIEAAKSGGPFKFASLTCFASSNTAFDETINLLYGLNDTLLSGVTAKQWKTISAFSHTPELAKTADQLKLDASTVSRNLKRGYYWQLTTTAKVAASFIQRTFS